MVRSGLEPRTVDLDAFGGVQPDGFRVLGVTYAAGTSVDGVGDVDGDGLDDIAVGDPATYQGSVSIVHGRAGGADVDLAGAPPGVLRVQQRWGDPIGRSVGAVGDVDGDGAPDVVMTGDPMPPGTNENEIDPGGAYVLHGGAQTGALTVQDLEAGRGGFPILGFSRAAGDGVDASGAGGRQRRRPRGRGPRARGRAGGVRGVRAHDHRPGPARGARDSGYRIERGGGGASHRRATRTATGAEDLLATSFEDGGSVAARTRSSCRVRPGASTVDLRAFDGTQERGRGSAASRTPRSTASIARLRAGRTRRRRLRGHPAQLVRARGGLLDRGDVRCRHGDDHVAVLEQAGTTSAAGTGGAAATAGAGASATPVVGAGAPLGPRPRLSARLRGARLVATATCGGRGALTVRWRGAGVVRRTIAARRTVRWRSLGVHAAPGWSSGAGRSGSTRRLRVRRRA